MRVINTATQKYREQKSIPAGENQARHLSLTLKTILHLDFQRLVKKISSWAGEQRYRGKKAWHVDMFLCQVPPLCHCYKSISYVFKEKRLRGKAPKSKLTGIVSRRWKFPLWFYIFSNFLQCFMPFSLFLWHFVACQDPSSLTKDPFKPVPPAMEVWNPNHWTLREFPAVFKISCIFLFF